MEKALNYVVTSKELLPLPWNYAETLEEAEQVKAKYINSLNDDIAMFEDYAARYDKDYWLKRMESAKRALESIMVVSWDEYNEAIRQKYLADEPDEITAGRYFDMLGVLPPLKWCEIDGVEMFCISEMDFATYTHQYGYDKRTDKYWHKMVDCRDKSTWLHNFIRR